MYVCVCVSSEIICSETAQLALFNYANIESLSHQATKIRKWYIRVGRWPSIPFGSLPQNLFFYYSSTLQKRYLYTPCTCPPIKTCGQVKMTFYPFRHSNHRYSRLIWKRMLWNGIELYCFPALFVWYVLSSAREAAPSYMTNVQSWLGSIDMMYVLRLFGFAFNNFYGLFCSTWHIKIYRRSLGIFKLRTKHATWNNAKQLASIIIVLGS